VPSVFRLPLTAAFRFRLLLAAYSAYAIALIWRTSVLVDGHRYFCLLDDSMISMRYAANLAHGFGLTWNPGQPPVEGYTNPLWLLYMALLHLVPLSPSQISLIVQLSGALFLLCNLVVVRKLARDVAFGSESVAFAAAVLTASYFALNNWGMRGSEVSILTLFVSFCTWLGLRTLTGSKQESFWLYLLLGLGTLIRPDMAVFAAALILALFAFGDGAPAVRIRRLLFGASILAVFLGLQTAFRLYYYGDLLPNTYYLKMTGYPLLMRVSRGTLVALRLGLELSPVFLIIRYGGIFHRASKPVVLLTSVIAAQLLYSIWVGGDAWEWWGGSNRYISIAIPLVMILAALGLNHWIKRPHLLSYQYAFGITALIVALNATNLGQLALVTKPPETDDNRTMIREALLVERLTRPQASIAVVWAGIIPYMTQRPSIDLLGMNDFVVAHEPMHVPSGISRWWSFLPGHLKWDYGWSIGHLRPDLVLHVWRMTPADEAYLTGDYETVQIDGFTWRIRRDSKNIYWDRLTAERRAQARLHPGSELTRGG
jgi:hypothetical protein